ncbi:MAG: beta-ketoacyl-ACP synthase II [Balneolales bacterium]|nr:beta-ketoacyl-ACP synthase II [Balneolales bacterium]
MNRVVITGLGAVTPIGNDVPTFWENAVAGKSGAGPITRFDPSAFRTRIACEVKGFKPEERLDRNEIRKNDLYTHYALYAADEAMQDSGFDVSAVSPFDCGVIWGTGMGGLRTIEQEITEYCKNPERPRFSPFFVPKIIPNIAAGAISIRYGLQGISFATISACATANAAIIDAFTYISIGKAKMMVAGGSEASITEAFIGGFAAMKAMSTRNDDPQSASRPFDAERDGFVMGEGAGALILEDYEHAKKRGAKIYAEIVGTAMTSDAYHISSTHPEGTGAAKGMELALKEARANPDEVDHLNGHATSTPVGDISEIKAIQTVFGNDLKHLKMSATKSMTGHLMGAAGAIEAVITVKSIQDGIIPPVINTVNADEQIPASLDIVYGEARETPVNLAISNTFGFGGHNAIVAFKKV